MCPALAGFDARYGARKNAIFISNDALQSAVCADSKYLSRSKLRCGASFASIGSSVGRAVSLISGRGIPSQIAKHVICGVAVIMAALMPCHGRPNKSEKNEAVNFHHPAFVVLPEKNTEATVKFPRLRNLQVSSPNIHDAAMVRDRIKRFVSDNVAPRFHHVPLLRLWSMDYSTRVPMVDYAASR